MKVPISETKSATSKLRNIETRSGAPKPAEFRRANVFSLAVANPITQPSRYYERQRRIGVFMVKPVLPGGRKSLCREPNDGIRRLRNFGLRPIFETNVTRSRTEHDQSPYFLDLIHNFRCQPVQGTPAQSDSLLAKDAMLGLKGNSERLVCGGVHTSTCHTIQDSDRCI